MFQNITTCNIDNIVVNAIPESVSVTLFSASALILGLARWYDRQE